MDVPERVEVLGMTLDEWKHESCIAHFGTGADWATLYDIESGKQNKGHATQLLLKAKDYYKGQGRIVAGTVALNSIMRRVYVKAGIAEISA